jgi:hypothetical protein
MIPICSTSRDGKNNLGSMSIFLALDHARDYIVITVRWSNGSDRWGLKMANGQLTYGDNVTIDFGALPVTSQHALAQYGLSHFLGNVQAAKMVARIRRDGIGDTEATSDMVSAWRKANTETVSVWTKEHLDAALAELHDGTVGTGRVGGPRKDPVETKLAALVLSDIRARLKGNGSLLKQFNKAKADDIIDFGGGVTRTRAQMIASTVASSGAALRKEAEKLVKEEARLAERAEKSVDKAEATPEALGF